jgi:nitrogen-specific signal transduction histidine kinase
METPCAMMYYLKNVAPVIHIPMYWTDLNANFLGASQAFLNLAGVTSQEDLLGKPVSECLSHDGADHIKLVLETRQVHSRDEKILDASSGIKRHFTSSTAPLMGKNGVVFGVIGTLVALPAEKYRNANHAPAGQQSEQKNKPDFMPLAQKVAHDIRSPLSALSVMLSDCDEMSEKKRLIVKNAVATLTNIANNLISQYKVNQPATTQDEERRPILCSEFLLKVVSQSKYQYQNLPVKFEVEIKPEAQFVFILAQPSQLARAVSNVISNAVDALRSTTRARLTVSLEVEGNVVSITIKDNGIGMPPGMTDRIMKRESFTAGKENGHGLGLMQVWDMVDQNDVVFSVTSQPAQGTSFKLRFAKTDQADWIVDEINFRHDDIIVILDDDQLIHDAWDLRVGPLLPGNPDLHVRHEKEGKEVIRYIGGLKPEDKQRVCLFCDFELINQNMTGLTVIETCRPERAFLVTSYYDLATVQKSATDLGIKVLPKQMALVTPMFCEQRYGVKKLNIDHIMYDKNFYNIDQFLESYGVLESSII